MTNEEKAEEICKRHIFDSNHFDCCMEMAEWKDEQYNEEKRDLLGLVKMLKIDEHNQTIIEDLVAILNK